MSNKVKNEKVIPEWDVDADEQIVLIGVLAFILLSLAIGVGLWRSGSDDQVALDPGLAAVQASNTNSQDLDAVIPTTLSPSASTTEVESAAPTTIATTTPPTTEATTTAPPTTTRNLEPDVVASLTASGVAGPAATLDGTTATVRGTVESEEARAAAIAAASGVAGVSNVIDQLTVVVPVSDRLNELFELAPIQFATSSPQILEASFPTLDSAADILSTAPEGTSLEVQGYTDLAGSESKNLTLSQQRADAVVAYLTNKGVPADLLQAKGYGETDQFEPGDLAENYEANRRVRFELLGG